MNCFLILIFSRNDDMLFMNCIFLYRSVHWFFVFFPENFHQSNAGQLTESSRFPGSENVQVDSTKSLDTGINK